MTQQFHSGMKMRTENRCLNKSLSTHVHSSAIQNGQEVETTRCSSWMFEWIKTTWSMPTWDYYSATKRNKVLTHDTTLTEP